VSCSSSLSLLSQTTDGLVQAVPVLVHPMQFGAAARREPVVLARGTFLRLLDVRLDESAVPQPAQDRIHRPLADHQMVDVAQAADDVVAVERPGRNGVEDRQLEQSLAKLRHPVVEGEIRHGIHNELRQGTCQCKVAYGEDRRRFRLRRCPSSKDGGIPLIATLDRQHVLRLSDRLENALGVTADGDGGVTRRQVGGRRRSPCLAPRP
jgi:hypothetical protein